MEKKIIIGMIALILVLSLISFSSASVWNKSIAYYKFNEGSGVSVNDEVGNHDLVVANDWIANGGLNGSALNVNSNQNVFVINASDGGWVSSKQLSINFWMRNKSASCNNGGDGSPIFALTDKNIPAYQFDGMELYLFCPEAFGQRTIGLYFPDQFHGIFSSEWSPILQANLSDWMMVTVVINLADEGDFYGSAKFYVNGQLTNNEQIDLLTYPNGFTLVQPDLVFFKMELFGQFYMADELSVYNSVLTQEDVTELYTNISQGISQPPINITINNTEFNLTAEHQSPIRNASVYVPVTFNVNLSVTNSNITNATLYVWNSTDLVLTDFKSENIVNTSAIESWSEILPLNKEYSWNVYVCEVTGQCIFDEENETFYTIPSTISITSQTGIMKTTYPDWIGNEVIRNYTIIPNESIENFQAFYLFVPLTVNNTFIIPQECISDNKFSLRVFGIYDSCYDGALNYYLRVQASCYNYSSSSYSIMFDNNPPDFSCVNLTFGVQDFYPFFTINNTEPVVQVSQGNLIKGSGAIYEVLNSAGAGLGSFIAVMGVALPTLLIGLGFVAVIISIAFGITHIIKVSMNRR